MRCSSLLTTAFAILPLTEALVGLTWKVTNTPSNGLTDITFPFSIADAPHKTGFYFAQQFNFVNIENVGYTGLQPRPDTKDGKPIVHAAFSSFVAGTTSTSENCSDGADGGAGVSCAIEIPAPYHPLYHIVVKNTGGTTWTGTLIDTENGNSTQIGEFTLPDGAGGIKSSQMGFIEYYPWNGQPSHTCDSLPFTNVTFGNPTTSTKGAIGSVQKPYEYGDCVGKAAFEVKKVNDGYESSVGF